MMCVLCRIERPKLSPMSASGIGTLVTTLLFELRAYYNSVSKRNAPCLRGMVLIELGEK